MRELALVAFFAETALVVFADEVADAGAFGGRDVVPVWTGDASRAVAGFVVGAEGAGDFGGPAEGGEGAGEVAGEGEGWCAEGVRVEDLVL